MRTIAIMSPKGGIAKTTSADTIAYILGEEKGKKVLLIVYSEEANKELKRMRKSRVFREMEEAYRNNMFPECPECGKNFDPLKITCWTKAGYVKQGEIENNEKD